MIGEGDEARVAGTEFHIGYSQEFKWGLDNMMMGGGMDDDLDMLLMEDLQNDNVESQFDTIKPVSHGYAFDGMYSVGDQISLQGKVISSYFFDQDGHFAGVAILDALSMEEVRYVPEGMKNLTVLHADKEVYENHSSMRVVGFRTGKRCHNESQISAIMPIYYSRNEEMCKNYLAPISRGMQEEISEYGLECNDAELKLAM